MTKATFLAPVYNKGAWIAETIESLQAQTLEDIEILFINDGSTDNTLDVIRCFQKDDKRIKVKTLPINLGLGKAWNIGTKLVNSPIICVASGDDIWNKDRAKLTCEYFYNHPNKSVFYGSFYFCDARMNPIEYKPALPYNRKKLLTPRKDGFCPQYIGHFVMAYWTSVGRKVPYRENLKVGIDYPFLADLAHADCKFGWTKEVLGFARLLKSGVSMSRRQEVVNASKI